MPRSHPPAPQHLQDEDEPGDREKRRQTKGSQERGEQKRKRQWRRMTKGEQCDGGRGETHIRLLLETAADHQVFTYSTDNLWQSRVEIEGYSVTYFDRITAFEAPYH